MEERIISLNGMNLKEDMSVFADDAIEVLVQLARIPEDMYPKIFKAVKNEMLRTATNMKEFYGRDWNEIEIKDVTLSIRVQKGKPIETYLIIYFEEIWNHDDQEDSDPACGTCEINMDFSDCKDKLQDMVMAGIRNTFF